MKKLISTTILATLASVSVNAYSAQDKVSICHNYQVISVAEPAVASHVAHGDFTFNPEPEGPTPSDCVKPPGVPGAAPVTGNYVVIIRCEGTKVISITDSSDAGTAVEPTGNCPQAVGDYLASGMALRSVTGVASFTEYLLLGKAGEEEVNPL